MKKMLCYVGGAIWASSLPITAYALSGQVDFTSGIMDHAGLVLALFFTLGPAIGLFGKMLLDKQAKTLEDKSKKLEEQEDKAWEAELKAKEAEIKALKERVDKFEYEHNACNRTLPVTYVTRTEFDKFTEQHRMDLAGLTNRLENMIRDLRMEIKSDMTDNINRIIDMLKEMK